MTWMKSLAIAAVIAGTASSATAAADWAKVGQALGKTGAVQPGGVYRVGLPRTDLNVTLDGVPLKPGLALGSWLAFRDLGDHAMVMGDVVLAHEEVNPVLRALEQNGIEITALHNHLLRSSPATMYMHVEGHGDAVRLATALHTALSNSRTPLGDAPAPSAPPAPMEMETAVLDRLLGAKGNVNGGVYQVSIPRAAPPTSGGMPIPTAMGSAIAINIQPTGGGRAVTTGDFVLIASEVNPVMARWPSSWSRARRPPPERPRAAPPILHP